MDRFLALQAFARVVELGGFTKAADSLQLSKTTVSDLVQGLENHLGVRLLQRTTRRVSATSDGAAFYERSAHILRSSMKLRRPSCKLASQRQAGFAWICRGHWPRRSSFPSCLLSWLVIPTCASS